MKPVALAALALGLAGPVPAAELTNMFTIDGACESLVVQRDDLTADCQGSVMQMVYDSGRVGLYAFSGSYIVTFSGTSDEVVGTEIHQTLDKVLVGTSETDIVSHPVKGTCTFENPYSGVALFTCSARGKAGETYSLSFRTDGAAPVDELGK